jgi:hypothetical protein
MMHCRDQRPLNDDLLRITLQRNGIHNCCWSVGRGSLGGVGPHQNQRLHVSVKLASDVCARIELHAQKITGFDALNLAQHGIVPSQSAMHVLRLDC